MENGSKLLEGNTWKIDQIRRKHRGEIVSKK